jgi:hypothetical protein
MIFRQYFKLTGIISSIAYDAGLQSTQSEKKRLLSVSVVMGGINDNQFQGWHERAKVFDIPDRLLDYEGDAFNTDMAKPGARINEIEVGLDIPVGETFKVAIKSGAALTEAFGTYNYELITG